VINSSKIDLPKLNVGKLEFNLIQGGMGVGISGQRLASAVANCGGAGIIAAVGLGILKDFPGKYTEANMAALQDEIKKARQNSDGVIGVNIMHALTDYKQMVGAAVEAGIDLIISGAGLSNNLPTLVGDADVVLVPIVSDVRVARIITKYWRRQNHKIPDAFIVEGPKAGGHLGYKYEDLVEGNVKDLDTIASEVIEFANDPKKFDEPVPVIVAGGIYTGQDIAHYRKLGAAGVQMGTRFVTTLECDAHDNFKQEYIRATEDDIVLIRSPVNFPGRAIKNEFLEKVMKGDKIDFRCKYKCLEPCKASESPYCIAKALVGAQKGDFTEGFAFAGANAYLATPETCLDESGKFFITVETLMERISAEYHSAAD